MLGPSEYEVEVLTTWLQCLIRPYHSVMHCLQWLRWHHGANVLLAGTESGEVYMWRIPGGDCKLLPGHGNKTDCGLILPDGMQFIIKF